MFVNVLSAPDARRAVSEPSQPRPKRGAFGALRPEGGTHAKALLPSLVSSLLSFLSSLSASRSTIRSGPRRNRTGSAAIRGRRVFIPLPGIPNPGLAKGKRPPSSFRRLKRGAREPGGSLRPGDDPAGPSSFSDPAGLGGVPASSARVAGGAGSRGSACSRVAARALFLVPGACSVPSQ